MYIESHCIPNVSNFSSIGSWKTKYLNSEVSDSKFRHEMKYANLLATKVGYILLIELSEIIFMFDQNLNRPMRPVRKPGHPTLSILIVPRWETLWNVYWVLLYTQCIKFLFDRFFEGNFIMTVMFGISSYNKFRNVNIWFLAKLDMYFKLIYQVSHSY